MARQTGYDLIPAGLLVCLTSLMGLATADQSMNNTTTPGNLSAEMIFLIQASQEPTFQAGVLAQRYGAPIIIILGLVGNTISLIVMLQRRNRRISAGVYMAALAIFDNASLLTLAYLWIVTEFVEKPWSSAGCKVWVYIVFLTTAGSAFTLLVVNLDRCVAIRFPIRSISYCTPRRAGFNLLATYIFVAIFYMPMAAMSDAPGGVVCAAFAVRSKASEILSYFNLIALPIVPFIMILVMNILIIKSVWRSDYLWKKDEEDRRGSMTNGHAPQNNGKPKKNLNLRHDARNRQLTLMLLVVSFTFLIIILPISVRVVAYIFIDYQSSTAAYGVFVLLYSVLNLLLFLNNAINFYLYCITGSKFRADVRALFCKKKKKDSSNQKSTSGTPVEIPSNGPQEAVAETKF